MDGKTCSNCRDFRSLPFQEGDIKMDGICLAYYSMNDPHIRCRENDDWCNAHKPK